MNYVLIFLHQDQTLVDFGCILVDFINCLLPFIFRGEGKGVLSGERVERVLNSTMTVRGDTALPQPSAG